MKTRLRRLMALACLLALSACTAGTGAPMRVNGYHGYGPWWGHPGYYHGGGVVVAPPPGGIEPPVGAQPPVGAEPPMAGHLPEPPMDMPDMGMPDVEIDPF
jgi:hypothetical protein